MAKLKSDEEEALSKEAKTIARSFRYMRRKPTIISYKPPEGKFQHYHFFSFANAIALNICSSIVSPLKFCC